MKTDNGATIDVENYLTNGDQVAGLRAITANLSRFGLEESKSVPRTVQRLNCRRTARRNNATSVEVSRSSRRASARPNGYLGSYLSSFWKPATDSAVIRLLPTNAAEPTHFLPGCALTKSLKCR